jgi:hypothetical protein
VHFGLGQVKARESLPVTLKWRDTAGRPREATLRLAPGWHTVLLGAPATPPALVAKAAASTGTKGEGR